MRDEREEYKHAKIKPRENPRDEKSQIIKREKKKRRAKKRHTEEKPDKYAQDSLQFARVLEYVRIHLHSGLGRLLRDTHKSKS